MTNDPRTIDRSSGTRRSDDRTKKTRSASKLAVSDEPANDGRSSKPERQKPSRRKQSRTQASPSGKTGGVAPFVRPAPRWKRLWRRRHRLHQGFVPLTPQRDKRLHRILPRTVIGIATMFLAFGIGAAFSGAAFYAYYDDRLAHSEEQVAEFVEGFDAEFADAAVALEQLSADASLQIANELAPLGDWTADANGIVDLPASIGPSVWLVETFDEGGNPVVGSAFAVTGHNGGTALVTSLSVVRAATVSPAPPLTLVKGEQRFSAVLHTWDEGNDLALLLTDAEIPPLDLASAAQTADAVGRRVFILGGVGAQGASAIPGSFVDLSDLGLQHTVPVGNAYRGGPIVTGDGLVLGVSSLAYRPLGVDPGAVGQAPAATAICATVLSCANGQADGLDGDLSSAEGATTAEADTPAADAGGEGD